MKPNRLAEFQKKIWQNFQKWKPFVTIINRQ